MPTSWAFTSVIAEVGEVMDEHGFPVHNWKSSWVDHII